MSRTIDCLHFSYLNHSWKWQTHFFNVKQKKKTLERLSLFSSWRLRQHAFSFCLQMFYISTFVHKQARKKKIKKLFRHLDKKVLPDRNKKKPRNLIVRPLLKNLIVSIFIFWNKNLVFIAIICYLNYDECISLPFFKLWQK